MMHPYMGEGPHGPTSSHSLTHQTVTVSATAFCWPFYQKNMCFGPVSQSWGAGVRTPSSGPACPQSFQQQPVRGLS